MGLIKAVFVFIIVMILIASVIVKFKELSPASRIKVIKGIGGFVLLIILTTALLTGVVIFF